MSVDIVFAGKQGDDWVVELLCVLENKGLVPYTIRDLHFTLRAIRQGDEAIDGGPAIRSQLEFAHRIKAASWTPEDSPTLAVLHPGVKMRYSYVQKVPGDSSFVLLHGVLDYGTPGLQSRADRVRRVPATPASGLGDVDEQLDGR